MQAFGITGLALEWDEDLGPVIGGGADVSEQNRAGMVTCIRTAVRLHDPGERLAVSAQARPASW